VEGVHSRKTRWHALAAYLLIDERDKIAAAVDPVEPKKVLAAAEKEGVPIKAIYSTHHHWYARICPYACASYQAYAALYTGTTLAAMRSC
jgi:hypothetical protein